MTKLQEEELLSEFIKAQAIQKGHFILSSGLHSDTYIQCAKVMMDPNLAEKLCKILASKIISRLGSNFADIVVSPAMGGVIVGFELARHLGLKSIFCERVNGNFTFRRGFNLEKGSRVLVVEDVVTTAKSSLETYEAIENCGAKIVAQASLIDRSNGVAHKVLKVDYIPLLKVDVKTFDINNTPKELRCVEPVKPGSRFLKN